MGMITFLEEDIRYLETELPDIVNFYRFSGDFAAEIAAIDDLLSRSVSESMRKRLRLERVIAEGMLHDYGTDFDSLLQKLKSEYPRFTAGTLRELISLGYIDFILKNGQYFFQNAAQSSIRKTCSAALAALGENGKLGEFPIRFDEEQRKNAALMREKGGRAFRFTVRMSLRPRDAYVREGEPITVHLPYPARCEEQPEITLLSSTHKAYISNSDHRTACIRTTCHAGEEYAVTFRFVHRQSYRMLDFERVSAVQPRFYTEEKPPHIRFTPYIRSLAEEIRCGETNPLITAKKIYDYITENIRYSYMREYLYLDSIPLYALLNGRGDCGVQGLAFITLCRAVGIPARWQSGCTVKASGVGSHDWAQIYIAPYGWIPVDPSFGGGAYRRRDTEMRDYYFGNLDPFRLVSCNDVQVPFDPPKRFLRMDPYDNQSGEAEYDGCGLGFGELSVRREVLQAEDVGGLYF